MAPRLISKFFAVLLLGMAGCTAVPSMNNDSSPLSLSDLAWMAGSWESSDGHSEETWLPPRGGSMFGVNRSTDGERTLFFEYMRIEVKDGAIAFLASPLGRQPPSAFPMIDAGDRRVVFENVEHDFPQRITYWRHGRVLHGRIDGIDEGEPKSAEWQWRLVR